MLQRERYEHLQSRPVKASVEELLAISKSASAQVKQPYLGPCGIPL